MAVLVIASGGISLIQINEKVDQVELCVKAEDEETSNENRLSNDAKEDSQKSNLNSVLKLIKKATRDHYTR
jgi:hypothetical protein